MMSHNRISFIMTNILSIVNTPTPCGDIVLGDINGSLCLSDWILNNHHLKSIARICKATNVAISYSSTPIIESAITQLSEYFQGNRTSFQLPTMLVGTDFQKAVWRAINNIPFGCLISYSELAQTIGMPRAVRAVANAVGANPLPIIIPCHRVTTNRGEHTGFSGGINAKLQILTIESK